MSKRRVEKPKAPKWCVNCDVAGHDRHDADVCPRYHAGPRNRHPDALRPTRCAGCALVLSWAGVPALRPEMAARLLVAADFTVAKALEQIRQGTYSAHYLDTVYEARTFEGSYWEAVRFQLIRAERNAPLMKPDELSAHDRARMLGGAP